MNYREEARRILASEDAEQLVKQLLVGIHELKRTRSEDQAKARVEGFKEGEASVISQLRAQKLEVEVSDDQYFSMPR